MGPIARESLRQVPLTNVTLISAESIPAGGFTPPRPRHCRFLLPPCSEAFHRFAAKVTARLT
jgi:hypothetical protein